jgi:hypothetical protein
MTSFDAHWVKYLARRSRITTRLWHYFGLLFGQVAGIGLALWFQSWPYLFICLVSYIIVKASRETPSGSTSAPYFTKAIFNTMCFFRMLALEAAGQLGPEVKRAKHL